MPKNCNRKKMMVKENGVITYTVESYIDKCFFFVFFLLISHYCEYTLSFLGIDRQGGSEPHKDSDHKTSHCFSGRVLPRKTAECRSDRPLPSLELVTHKTHKCCQTGAYRTLNKRGHIPGVFPHEVTSCSRGRMGCWEFTGDLLRRTLPPPKVLSALFMFFSPLFPSLRTIFIFLSICTSQSHCLCPSQWNYESWSEVLF